ncbi:hypothetical protein N5W20_04325 [Candidatus Kirkpatrickella diaphorinae]|uniref:Uncharacterized protein n=1 Tax=Candidatus Kirkpatrickella diaphorinae TaxID=2984322 RepID=A0ABY6GKM2_9PROT|nr:hypothetical protein [Candidatus Kirkpatrickella diaphorinae]UYH52087.1 hypothetical protein N5W20_04325 [Candidatus Kirkpatrickella diaphorinae]
MLEVSFDLITVMTLLLGIGLPGIEFKFDNLNNSTAEPILDGRFTLKVGGMSFKAL